MDNKDLEYITELENPISQRLPFLNTKDILIVGLPGDDETDDPLVPINMLLEHMNNLTEMSASITNAAKLLTDSMSMRTSSTKQKQFSDHLEALEGSHFFRKLRVNKDIFYFLVDKISDKYSPKYSGGNFPVEPKTAVMMCLWYLGNKHKYREMAELFGFSEAALCKIVQMVVNIICDMGKEFIKWPSGTKLKENENKFNSICGFPGVIGVIGGNHIEIRTPKGGQLEFLDQTNKHSVHLLAVCDSEKRFIFIDAGFPGCADNMTVLQNTLLHHKLVNSPEDIFPSNYYHVVGNSAFHLSNHLLVPYQDFGILNRTQKEYNRKLSQTCSIIEKTFNILKGRFSRLKYIDAQSKKIPSIITACCIIHNIILDRDSKEEFLTSESFVLSELDNDYSNEPIHFPEDGYDKRDVVATLL